MQQPENESGHVLVSPLWVFICRIFQVLISLVILALAARLMHDAYLDEEGLALAIVSDSFLSIPNAKFKPSNSELGYHHLARLLVRYPK